MKMNIYDIVLFLKMVICLILLATVWINILNEYKKEKILSQKVLNTHKSIKKEKIRK